MLYYIGIIATVLLILFAILYSLLGYNNVFRDRFIEHITEQANKTDMKDESLLKGERIYIPREGRRSVRVNLYRYADEDPSPVLFFAHGGNFLNGDSDLDDAFCESIAEEWKVTVVSISYTKIKEHVTTYPQEEIRDTVVWFRKHADEYHLNKNRFILMGKEAGAYLSLLAAVMLVSTGVMPSGVIFVNPFIDYVAVSLAVAGLHPGPVALALTQMTDMYDEYDEELDRAGIYVKTKVGSGKPFEEDQELLGWTKERVNDFFWR
jgi:acetyl esterase/lipase